jgi:hypothetical protein
VIFSGSLYIRKLYPVPEIKCFILKVPLPIPSQNDSSLRYCKEDGWKTRNFFHHCIEYEKNDGFYEYVTIYDDSGVDQRLYQASLVTFDLQTNNPYAIVSVRGTASLKEIQADNPAIEQLYDKHYQGYLYTA